MSETARPGDFRRGDHRLALPAGRTLGEYRIERVLGVSPFGVTYLALDRQNRRFVIKEYAPADIVTRDGAALRGESPGDDDLLRRGRDRFLSDGKRLQRVKHASVVRLHNAFEANQTGYLVFEHESGETLADVLNGAHALADEPLLRRFAFTMLEALEAVHEVAFLHGKVEPSNILLRSDGTPVLLDFGNARAASGLTRRASMALVPGYAAIEQYTSHEAQGPWTDLYGLAAVLYRVVSGKDPLDAPARLLEDRLVPAAETGSGRFSKTFLRAIDAALVVRPEGRPQTVAEWRPMLDKPLAPKAMEARKPANADDDEIDDYVPNYGAREERSRTWIYATAGVVSVAVLGTLALAGIGYMSAPPDPRRLAANNYPSAPSSAPAAAARDEIMPLPPAEDAAAREARLREDERRVAAQIAAARQAEEQRAREAARQREQARQEQERQAAAAQQEQARQQQARQEQARQEQERQAAARAAEEARQREAAARQEAARQEQARQEQARQEAARQEAARQEQARAEQAKAEQAKAEQAKAEQERQAAARAAEESRQRAAAQQQEQERQAQATRVAEEIRQREIVRQQEQAAAARTLEEARAREQARAPAETSRAPTSSGSAMLLPPPPPLAGAGAGGGAPVQLTAPAAATPPVATFQQSPPPQVARATAPPLVQPPAARPEPVVATPAPAARAAVDVGRIDAVNWQWGYVVMQMEQRQAMQVGDRVYTRSGDTKLWMTVRRVSGTQVSAVPDSDLQRYSVNGRVYKE